MTKDREHKPPPTPTKQTARAHGDAKTHGSRGPDPATADRLAGGTWTLAHAPIIDLGDAVVGQRLKSETHIFALDRQGQGPRFFARVTGDPSIALVQAPTYLPAAGGTFDPNGAIRFDFLPGQPGNHEATLDLHIVDAPRQQVSIPIRAGAHLPGANTRAEAAEATAEAARAREEEVQRGTREAAIDRAIAAEREIATPYHEGKRSAFDSAYEGMKESLRSVLLERRQALTTASIEIGTFVRTKPADEQPSLLEQLAWGALDLATAGIAGGIAKSLGPAVATLFVQRGSPERPGHRMLGGRDASKGVPPISPGSAFVAAITDGIKHVVKTGGSGAKHKLQGGSGSSSASAPHAPAPAVGSSKTMASFAMTSADPKAAYFQQQAEGLRAPESAAMEGAIRARDALLPTLRTDPEAAIAALKCAQDVFKEEIKEVHQQQAEQTVRHWVRYVQETTLDGRSANTAFNESHPLEKLDGLIDVQVKAVVGHPERPVERIGARLNGVRKATVTRLAKHRLLDLGLAVRATSDFDSPTVSITVVRDASGNVEFTDNTSVDWQTGRWFERKAAAYGLGRDRVKGAKVMIEREVMSMTLDEITDGKMGEKVENDSAT